MKSNKPYNNKDVIVFHKISFPDEIGNLCSIKNGQIFSLNNSIE